MTRDRFAVLRDPGFLSYFIVFTISGLNSIFLMNISAYKKLHVEFRIRTVFKKL